MVIRACSIRCLSTTARTCSRWRCCWHGSKRCSAAPTALIHSIALGARVPWKPADLSAARRIVSDALGLLVLAAVPNPQWQTDLERRLGRLDRRLGTDHGRAFALTGCKRVEPISNTTLDFATR